MSVLENTATKLADALGRESWLVRRLRPVYESLLYWSSRGSGTPWTINGVVYRVDARHRRQLGHEYDARVASFLRGRVEPGTVCVNVGANVGVYVLQLAHWSRPTGRVIAFEPNPMARTVLENHVGMNGLTDRVTVVGAAVGDRPHTATLYASGTDGMSRLGAPNEALAGRTREIEVPVVTLDEYCETKRVTPDWLLIDIEGFEIAALAGARQVIRTRGKDLHIVVEMHPASWGSAGASRADAECLLADLRLHAFPLTDQIDALNDHGLVYLKHE
jgi:FkbM family methyltransferase